jgi:hypothetical protein
VTRLGEFSPNWAIAFFGKIFLKIKKVTHIFGPLFPLDFRQQMVWATFLGVFLQTHLVTLPFLLVTRVTRLGEFSPIGRLFTLCSFFFKYRSSQISGLFFHGKSYYT